MKRGRLTCKICGRGSTYKIEREESMCACCGNMKIPELVHSSDRHRATKKQCASCYKKEMLAQMHDEIGGFLGNRSYHGDENLTALAKAIVGFGWARHYGASEYQVYKALKDNQDEEEGVLMWPDGDTKTLER